MARPQHEQFPYPRWRVEAWIDGQMSDCPGCPSCGFAGGPHEAERPVWAEARAVIEHFGLVDQEAFAEVIDLERALTALSHHHPKAAAVVATLVLLPHFDEDAGYTPRTDMARAFGERANWGRLRNAAVAWMSAYLSGRDRVACERAYDWAYRRAR